ncbi:MAG: tetratricopeptide repeat protein [Rhizobiaceae bacterium]|nr:tetratricopeptide repeat protein [Rhizobiaceae bacterium]
MREIEAITGDFRVNMSRQRYHEALACCERALSLVPQLPGCHNDAAICCLHLNRWQEAVEHCKAALRYRPPTMSTLDVLSHAYGCLGQFDEVRKWGRMALEMRLEAASGPPVFPHDPPHLPPAPSPQTREHNLIAFSLFGALPKYCETAVHNAEAQPLIYPDWTCIFYVDETVPQKVIARLRAANGRVIQIPDFAKGWPGPMWRLLAYDAPGLHRVIFRDADSLISTREANAVSAWVESGRRFHQMRDYQSHTELMLAGLWGCVGGALPPMRMLVDMFLREPVVSAHFADQHFLRRFVWPYARASLMQHDSMFGFLEHAPFPDGPASADFHVGMCESANLSLTIEAPDDSRVEWTLVENTAGHGEICSYTNHTRSNRIHVSLPSQWVAAYKAGDLEFRYLLYKPGQ